MTSLAAQSIHLSHLHSSLALKSVLLQHARVNVEFVKSGLKSSLGFEDVVELEDSFMSKQLPKDVQTFSHWL